MGITLPIIGTGSTILSPTNLSLKDVAVCPNIVPNIVTDLISVRKLSTDNQIAVELPLLVFV